MLDVDELKRDVDRYTNEADSYLRENYPGIFPEGKNISNFGHNNEIDAFRHAFVSGRLQQEYGGGQSYFFGLYHEITAPNPEPERDGSV